MFCSRILAFNGLGDPNNIVLQNKQPSHSDVLIMK
jgi:hypothetical protein